MPVTAAAMQGLLAEMHGASVLNGWDAVVCLSESAINKVLESGWNSQYPQGHLQGNTVWCDGLNHTDGGSLANLQHLEYELGPPQIELQPNSLDVTVRQPLMKANLKSGHAKVSSNFSITECPFHVNDSRVTWNESVPLASQQATVEGRASVSVVQDRTSAQSFSVTLNLQAGKLQLLGLLSGANHPSLADRLQQSLAAASLKPVLATVSVADDGTHEALRPTTLQANCPPSDRGKMLQLFMGTQGTVPQSTAINVPAHVLDTLESDYSLMISSQVMVQNVIVDRYNKGTGLVKLVAVAPQTDDQPWHAQTRNPMQYQGTISFGGAYPDIKRQAELGMNFVGTPSTGLSVQTYISPDSNIELQLGVSATYPLSISGTGIGQQLQLNPGPASVSATGLAETTVKPQLDSFLNNDIKNDMAAISLSVVSDFALKTMQFPGHIPKFEHVQFPGDLLIVGSLEPRSP